MATLVEHHHAIGAVVGHPEVSFVVEGERSLEELAVAYVDFAFRHPDLYWLMTERRFDRAALRAQNRLRLEAPLLAAFGQLLARQGSRSPAEDTLVAFAALHGLAALALGGRLDLGAARSARVRVREAARRLARLLTA